MRDLHDWNLSYAEARQLQKELAGQVQFALLKKEPRQIVGLDCAFSKDGKRIFAVAVMLRVVGLRHGSSPAAESFEFEHVETVSAQQETRFPYIPGLLSFREAPACLEAVEKLRQQADLFMIDGQGVAHPRRLGLAAHLGLFLNKPTIGCAKSRLIGTFEPPAPERGSHSPLWDRDEMIGAVVRTRKNIKPLFVSVGHRCTLDDAIRITLACAAGFRLPEPTRLAHHTVTQLRNP